MDTTAPAVTVPDDRTLEATGPGGASTTYDATATDTVDGDLAATCAPESGSTFPLGPNTVTCSATDAAGNTGEKTFTVRVVDTTAPVLTVPSRPRGRGRPPGRCPTRVRGHRHRPRRRVHARHLRAAQCLAVRLRPDDRDLHGHRPRRQRQREDLHDHRRRHHCPRAAAPRRHHRRSHRPRRRRGRLRRVGERRRRRRRRHRLHAGTRRHVPARDHIGRLHRHRRPRQRDPGNLRRHCRRHHRTRADRPGRHHRRGHRPRRRGRHLDDLGGRPGRRGR